MLVREDFTKEKKRIFNWLMLGCVLVAAMVVVGGITRLTQSGLSMVKWEPIMGALPPLNSNQWNEAFEMYKQTPEFRHYHSDFSLSDFKSIFFWEYLHRLLGRLIGLIFLIPCLYFWLRGSFNKKLKLNIVLILLWGVFQGVLGWVMVKSGLVDNPHVSHYRLAAHLVTALGLMGFIYYIALGVKFYPPVTRNTNIIKNVRLFGALLLLQIVYGAFVAGLKAGLMYNTFPKMGSEWFPEDLIRIFKREGFVSWTESGGHVQFIHRVMALSLIVLLFFIIWKAQKIELNFYTKQALLIVTLTLVVQVILGIITLLFAVPLLMGILHQFVAMVLLLSTIQLMFTIQKDPLTTNA